MEWRYKNTSRRSRGGVEYSSTLSLTLALDGVDGQRHAPAALPPKHPVPIVQEAGWASGPVWTDEKNLARTGIRSPDRPACSEFPYRLKYPGPRGDIPTLGLRSYGMLCSVDWCRRFGRTYRSHFPGPSSPPEGRRPYLQRG